MAYERENDLIRLFALEVRERGDEAVAVVESVSLTLLWSHTPDEIIPESAIRRELSRVETIAGPAAADLGRRLVAACREPSGELQMDALHYCRQWLDFFGGHEPFKPLVDAGLLTRLPTRLKR